MKHYNYKKIKKTILISLGIITVASTTIELFNWYHSYSKIEINQIQTFDNMWDKIWDKNSKTFTNRLNNNTIKKLEELTNTPKDKEKLDLAKASNLFVQINFNKSNLNQLISASNEYYQNQDLDDKFKEQETFNKTILSQIEELISQLNNNNEYLKTKNETLDFNENIIEEFQLKPISTQLKWSDLETINKNIEDINFLVKRQVEENNLKNQQQNIIDLKTKLEKFLKISDEYQQNIKENYITIKDFKEIIDTIYNIDINKNQNFFKNLKKFDNNINELNYQTTLSDEFFEKNSNIKKYKNQLQSINFNIQLKQDIKKTKIKSEEKEDQEFIFKNKLNIDDVSENLININTLQNLKFEVIQVQKIVKYENEKILNDNRLKSDDRRKEN